MTNDIYKPIYLRAINSTDITREDPGPVIIGKDEDVEAGEPEEETVAECNDE